MQTLRPSQVPEYLRASSFYLGLNAADDDEFSIPSNHMKLNMNVDTLGDMTELMNTIRFWGLDVFPEAMIGFAARQRYQKSADVESVLEPYKADLPFICAACCIASKNVSGNMRLEKAMDTGNIAVVRYFHDPLRVQFTVRAIAVAAGKGALDCLQYALSPARAVYYPHCCGNDVYSEAVRNGCMDSILFLQQSGFPLQQRPHSSNFYSCLGSYIDLPEIAASSGQCDVLKYLHSEGCSIRSAAIAAADAGHWDSLEYAMENGSFLCNKYKRWYHPDTLAQQLADAGRLKLFPMALSRVGEIDAQTTLTFAKTEKWELFQLCIQYITRPSLEVILRATEKGYVECLQRLHEVCVSEMEASGNGRNWLTYAASNSTSNGVLLPIDLVEAATKAQHWECLEFLITHGCPKSLSAALVQAGKQEAYLSAHGCEVSVQAACYFVRQGNLLLLQHALEHGCERSEEILRVAARHGELLCLKYAHAQGCPLSPMVLLAAARGGHGECLQYLNEHGCPSNEYVRTVLRKRSILGETK